MHDNVYVCMFTCTHTGLRVRVCTYIYAGRVHMWICKELHICRPSLQVCDCIFTCMYICMHAGLVCMCVCMFTCTHTGLHVCVCDYILEGHICTCMCEYLHVFSLSLNVFACVFTCMSLCMRACWVCMCVGTCLYVHTLIYMCMCIYLHSGASVHKLALALVGHWVSIRDVTATGQSIGIQDISYMTSLC